MFEGVSVSLFIAISFVVCSTSVIIFFFAFMMITSGKRLNRAQRFASSIIEFTPELILIMFDARGIVTRINSQHEIFNDLDIDQFKGKKLSQLAFLPQQLRLKNINSLPSRLIANITMDSFSHLMKWETRTISNLVGKTEFNIILGFDINELVKTQDKLKATMAHLAAAEERERKRIAEDLHDRIGEISILSTRKINDLKKSNQSQEMTNGLEDLNATIRLFLQKTRSLIFDLVPPVLYDIGLREAISYMANNFRKKHSIEIEVHGHFKAEPNQELAVFLLKAVREFVINAIKHGRADRIDIAMCEEDKKYVIKVEDNGAGFEKMNMKESLNLDSGFGLFHIKNRVEFYKGNLHYNSSEKLGGGLVNIWIPVDCK